MHWQWHSILMRRVEKERGRVVLLAPLLALPLSTTQEVNHDNRCHIFLIPQSDRHIQINKIDGFVKTLCDRHSGESRNPERIEITGSESPAGRLPPDQVSADSESVMTKLVNFDLLRVHQN